MTTYVYRGGKLVPKHLAPPLVTASAAPNVISDIMPETRHMANNQHYTSKSQFRAATKAAGCIEYGTEVATLLKPRKPVTLDRGRRREDIRRAIYDLRNR
jgi:hypothetical protein